jgi:hypothetical protein
MVLKGQTARLRDKGAANATAHDARGQIGGETIALEAPAVVYGQETVDERI